ncbi:MAG: VWA domain-containing protein [Pseudomonadota bacterium]
MIRRFSSDLSGNVAMMFGLFLIPILLGAGIAIDFIRANQVRSAIIEAADAGVLAAARAKIVDPSLSEAAAKAIAQQYFDANARLSGVSLDSFNFSFDGDDDKFQLVITGRTETSILGVVGQDYMPFSVNSEARARPAGPVEAVMVLDNSSSMAGAKLISLKASATVLSNALLGAPNGDFKVGMAPFAKYVNVGTSTAGRPWLNVPPIGAGDVWNGCVGSRPYPDNTIDANFNTNPVPGILNVSCPEPVTPLTDNQSTLETAIDNMAADYGTYIAGGLNWGLRLLSNPKPFNEARPKAQLVNKNGVRAVILLTDGANTRAPDYPTHDSYDDDLANQLTTEICNIAKADDIRIYTIAFEVSDPDTEALLRDCASEDGGYFDADNPSLLEAAFSTIAIDLVQLSLSK